MHFIGWEPVISMVLGRLKIRQKRLNFIPKELISEIMNQ